MCECGVAALSPWVKLLQAHAALPLTAEDSMHQQPGKRFTTMKADVTLEITGQ